MNSKTLLLISCLAAVPSVSAQQLRLGGGYSGSNVSEAGNEQWVGRAGYLLGADVLLGDVWFLRAGAHLHVRNLDYSIAGRDANGSITRTETEFQYTSRSLRVPLHLGRRLLDATNDPAFNLYLFAGPTALFNLDADLNNDALDIETSTAQWYIGGGAGLEFAFLFVEAGYDLGMSNIFSGSEFSTNPKVNTAYATAGIRLKLDH